GRQHFGLRQPQLLRFERGARGFGTRLGGLRGSQVLVDLLRTQRAGGFQRVGAIGIVLCIGRIGLGFAQRGARLRYLGLGGSRREGRQHLAALDRVADVDAHLGQLEAVRFIADDGFLPGGDGAVGGQADRQAGLRRLHGGDRQRRLGGFLFGRLVRAAREDGNQDRNQYDNDDERDDDVLFLDGFHFLVRNRI